MQGSGAAEQDNWAQEREGGEGQASPTGAVSALPCPPVMGTVWGQKRLIQDGVRHSSSASLAAAILSPPPSSSPSDSGLVPLPLRMPGPHSSCKLQQPTAFPSLEAELRLPDPPARFPARSCKKERRAA